MSDNEKRTKPKYEAPIVVPLGELAQGTGYCKDGTNAAPEYCSTGGVASPGYCSDGNGAAPGYCSGGSGGT
jgi:hypothetical protein